MKYSYCAIFFFFFLYKIFVDIKNKNKKYSSNENITNYYNLQMHYVCRFFFFFLTISKYYYVFQFNSVWKNEFGNLSPRNSGLPGNIKINYR